MALTFGKGNRSIAFAPTAAFPLNANSYFESYELALAAALIAKPAGDTTTKYYFGQEIAVTEMIDNVPQSAKLYIIAPETQEDGSIVGTLQEVGSATNGDGASIELVDGVLSVKDFGKRYYKYIAAVEGGEAAHYELTEGWVAGLEPRVVEEDGKMVIGWYEPNPTTAEGVKDQVVAVQGEVETLKTDVAGLKTAVGNVYTKEETYTKEDVNDLVSNAISGVFHFRGSVDSFDQLPAEKAEGDVYQVVDKEYAWNGAEWVELGFLVDLSSYTTRTYVDDAVKVVADDLDLAEEAIEALQGADTAIGERIDGIEEDITALVEEDERLAGLISGHTERIEALETAKTGFDTHFQTVDGKIEALETAKTGFDSQFETVNGKIAALEKADEGFVTHIGTLESYVGAPAGNLGALYPAVESLNQRLNNIVAEGGEPNQLNGISINGTLVPVNDGLIAELPIFTGSTAGLVSVAASELTANHILNAKGNWVNPFGDLGEKTVKEYVDQKVKEVVIEWSAI